MAQSETAHLVVFTDTFYETNGVGSYYRTLLQWCRRNPPARVTVICPRRDDLAPEPACDVVPARPSVNFRNPFYRDLMVGYYSRPALRRKLAALRGPLVAHIATSGPLGFAGASVARRLRIPAVGFYHTDMNFYARLYGRKSFGRFGEWLGEKVAIACERMAYGSCRAMAVPSATAEATVRKFYPGPIRIVPNPIDTSHFRPAPHRMGPFRERFGSAGRALVIVVGRVAQEKNLDLVCELLGNDQRIDLVFVGDGPYAPSLKERWNARVTGFLHGAELLGAFQQADLIVQLSLSETFGLSLVEGLACGLPAIVLRSPGFVQTLAPDRGVEILDTADLPKLADRCVALFNNRDEYDRRARLVRQLAESFSADAVFPGLLEFHTALCAAPAARPDVHNSIDTGRPVPI